MYLDVSTIFESKDISNEVAGAALNWLFKKICLLKRLDY
jgi:hypothetical protein